MANTDVVKAFKDLVAGNMEFSYRVDILYTNLRKQLENRVELNNSVANSPQQEDSSVDPVYIPEKSKDLFNILDKSFSLLSSPFYMARSSYTGALIEGTPERSLLKIHSVLSSINSGRRGSRGMLSDTTPYSEKLMLDEELREDSIEEATVDTIPGLLDQLLEVCSTDDVKSSKRDREEQEEIDTQDSNDTNSSMWDYIKEIFEWEIIRRIFKVVQAFGYRALRVVYVLTRNSGSLFSNNEVWSTIVSNFLVLSKCNCTRVPSNLYSAQTFPIFSIASSAPDTLCAFCASIGTPGSTFISFNPFKPFCLRSFAISPISG